MIGQNGEEMTGRGRIPAVCQGARGYPLLELLIFSLFSPERSRVPSLLLPVRRQNRQRLAHQVSFRRVQPGLERIEQEKPTHVGSLSEKPMIFVLHEMPYGLEGNCCYLAKGMYSRYPAYAAIYESFTIGNSWNVTSYLRRKLSVPLHLTTFPRPCQ